MLHSISNLLHQIFFYSFLIWIIPYSFPYVINFHLKKTEFSKITIFKFSMKIIQFKYIYYHLIT